MMPNQQCQNNTDIRHKHSQVYKSMTAMVLVSSTKDKTVWQRFAINAQHLVHDSH